MKFAPEVVVQFGLVPDGTLARLVGCNISSVRNRRASLGIPPCPRAGPPPLPDIPELGIESDRSLAARLGIDAASLSRERARRGIGSVKPGPKPGANAPLTKNCTGRGGLRCLCPECASLIETLGRLDLALSDPYPERSRYHRI